MTVSFTHEINTMACTAVPVHAIMAYRGEGGTEVQFHSFLTSELDGGGQRHAPDDLFL